MKQREIKYRARFNGKFAYFTLDDLRGHRKNVPTWVYEEGQSVHFDLFTGLKDKNGKEIYEGDIVRVFATLSGSKTKFIERIGKVIWSDLGWTHFQVVVKNIVGGFDYPNKISLNGIEIIGNIYNDSELLK